MDVFDVMIKAFMPKPPQMYTRDIMHEKLIDEYLKGSVIEERESLKGPPLTCLSEEAFYAIQESINRYDFYKQLFGLICVLAFLGFVGWLGV
ncbi:MAG: hypothetical protein Unbinned5081contig1002_4 [Prokaryotic dsDNA virus sp.]|nr:MAG: hypothetical protein Unbinned5081contig1002_4 [Prokaryotic dsDNA virus sp.]|tara:strand:+ start:6276 stop:6551 length:276 start_codon:yes stop_codon:yes gene_type:complete